MLIICKLNENVVIRMMMKNGSGSAGVTGDVSERPKKLVTHFDLRYEEDVR